VHRFLNCIGGYTSSRNSYSFAAMQVIMPHVIGGDPLSILFRGATWAEIEEDGELVVAFGGLPLKNSQVNPGGVGVHTVSARQQACRDAGVDFVNVSPNRDDTAEFLDAEWIPLRPNTDVALMLGIAHCLVDEGLHDKAFLERCCVGFDRFHSYLLGDGDGVPKTPEWTSEITRVPAETIRALARRIAAQRTVIAVSWSLQRAHHGEQPYWMGLTLAAMSGSLGCRGGGFGAGTGATHSTGLGKERSGVATLGLGSNPVTTFIPVARIADLLLDPGGTFDYDGKRLTYPDIRLVYWCGGNPFHHHQDLNRLVRAWQEPETVIVHEPFWNPNARHADIVFPAALMLERNDFGSGLGDEWLSSMEKAADPPRNIRTDYEIFAALADRLDVGDTFTEGRSADEWVRHLYEQTGLNCSRLDTELPDFETFRAMGRVRLPLAAHPHGDFSALRADPDAHPLETPSGRIEIFSDTIAAFGYDDCPGHPVWLEPAEWLGSPLSKRYPIHLLSNQPKTRLHSQFDHGDLSREAKVSGREPILLSDEDAAQRGIENGAIVRVFNDRGACLAGAVVTESLRSGVAILSTGGWYDPSEPSIAGSLELHGNPNVLTIDLGASRLSQGPSAQTVLVQVEAFKGDPIPVRAFEPPDVADNASKG
jgi:biotin/methionine sulfoxide reductase